MYPFNPHGISLSQISWQYLAASAGNIVLFVNSWSSSGLIVHLFERLQFSLDCRIFEKWVNLDMAATFRLGQLTIVEPHAHPLSHLLTTPLPHKTECICSRLRSCYAPVSFVYDKPQIAFNHIRAHMNHHWIWSFSIGPVSWCPPKQTPRYFICSCKHFLSYKIWCTSPLSFSPLFIFGHTAFFIPVLALLWLSTWLSFIWPPSLPLVISILPFIDWVFIGCIRVIINYQSLNDFMAPTTKPILWWILLREMTYMHLMHYWPMA